MTTRYKTDGEKNGVKRRMADYRQRLREAGLKPREVWATDAQALRIRSVVAAWQGEAHDLNPDQANAAEQLKPKE